MMNAVSLIGRTTKDVELRYSNNGTAFLKGTLAIQRRFNKEEADFIQFTIFSKGAEIFAQYTGKGSRGGLEGRIQTGKFDNKEGQTVFTTDVIVDNFTFLDDSQQSEKSEKPQSEPEANKSKTDKEPIDITDDLPF